MFDLSGKTALITGASRGIGETTARLFAERGARVVLAARSLGQELLLAQQHLVELRERGVQLLIEGGDLLGARRSGAVAERGLGTRRRAAGRPPRLLGHEPREHLALVGDVLGETLDPGPEILQGATGQTPGGLLVAELPTSLGLGALGGGEGRAGDRDRGALGMRGGGRGQDRGDAHAERP